MYNIYLHTIYLCTYASKNCLFSRKHSRESNVIVTRPKTACYDVYTLIKIGVDPQGLLPRLPQCLQEILHVKQAKNWTGAYGTAART